MLNLVELLKFMKNSLGDDPRKVPMKIFPAVHYSMGGLWVDYDQMTNIPGLFAAGECDYSQHGANRLGANSLLSAIYGGMVAGPNAVKYIKGLEKSSDAVSSTVFDRHVKEQEDKWNSIMSLNGTENAYVLHKELGEWMTDNVTVVRYNDRLLKTDEKIQELLERYKNININDTSKWSNQGAAFTRQLENMLQLARVITIGAYNRNESRGAHYKPDFPKRNDEEFLKTTMAKFVDSSSAPAFHYEEVDVSLIKPRERDYSKRLKGSRIDMSENKTVKFIITRQDSPNSAPYEEEFEVPYRPNMNVISALMEIRRNPVNAKGQDTTPVTWDMNCLEEVCGACSMVINGKPRQSCSALIDQLEQPIRLEPMKTFPVVRDLQVDRSRMFDALKKVKHGFRLMEPMIWDQDHVCLRRNVNGLMSFLNV